VVKVEIGPWTIPGFKLTRGQLLDKTLFGVGLVIPPSDMVFWPDVKLIDKIEIFNSDWIVEAVVTAATSIAEAAKDHVFTEDEVKEIWDKLEKIVKDP